MLFLTLLVAALVNTTLAGVVIITATTVLTSVSDAAQVRSHSAQSLVLLINVKL